MRTITLELLRHGPAHNQLLSPLTPYLALCENHAAVTLHVPFEHNQFLHRLSALGYRVDEESRCFQLRDTAKVMGEILGTIPGLTAESNRKDAAMEPLTHLRLIISASELALLPFELALSPDGLPGAGQHLLLQPQMPICLTREIRRVPAEQFDWPKEPRILFVAAAPPDAGAIPLESHLLTLRRLIRPWVKYYDDDERADRIADHLHVLPMASIEAIEEACSEIAYTHVHILAHGVSRQDCNDTRFFLALHDARDPDRMDLVSGTRLATALRAAKKPDSRGIASPAVVTLASCNSGDVGSVAGAGASIAHALHESGIPMVVAAQFPLSFEGSVRLVEVLYDGLLWGTDPRRLLYDLRRRLYSQFPTRHDWASLTAYVTLPPDFDRQLPQVQVKRVMGSIDAAMNHADEVTRRFHKEYKRQLKKKGSEIEPPEQTMQVVNTARGKIEKAKARLEDLLECMPSENVLIHGLLASTEKREAEVIHSAARRNLTEFPQKDYDKAIDLLASAQEHYWNAFLMDRSSSWPIVQYLSLHQILRNQTKSEKREVGEPVPPEENQESNLALAHALAGYELRSPNPQIRIWAHASLMEIYLLSLALKPFPKAEENALRHADELVVLAGQNSFDVYSSRRQILRYSEWFCEISTLRASQTTLARKISKRFPEEVEEKWK